MRKIDIYAEEHFGGDIQAALTHLYSGINGESLDPYVEELTREEARFIFDIIHQDAKAHYGSEEVYRAELLKARLLDAVDMSEEAVRNTRKNPFKKNVLTHLLVLLVGLPLAGALMALLGLPSQILEPLFAVVISLTAYRTVEAARRYFQFRRVKKLLGADETP